MNIKSHVQFIAYNFIFLSISSYLYIKNDFIPELTSIFIQNDVFTDTIKFHAQLIVYNVVLLCISSYLHLKNVFINVLPKLTSISIQNDVSTDTIKFQVQLTGYNFVLLCISSYLYVKTIFINFLQVLTCISIENDIFTDTIKFQVKLMVYNFVLLCISSYLYVKNSFINFLPVLTLISIENDVFTDTIKYICKHENKLYNVKFIDHEFINLENQLSTFKNNLSENIKLRKSINHCCIKEKDGLYLIDITEYIREFIHYLDIEKHDIDTDYTVQFHMWKYIKQHLNIKKNVNVCIYLNNIDSTEVIIQC